MASRPTSCIYCIHILKTAFMSRQTLAKTEVKPREGRQQALVAVVVATPIASLSNDLQCVGRRLELCCFGAASHILHKQESYLIDFC